MPGEMILRIWDVEHGQCAMLTHVQNNVPGRLAMIDSGCTDSWHPSKHIRYALNRTRLDYLFITNADQDHMSDLAGLWDEGLTVPVMYRNPTYTGDEYRRIKEADAPLTKDASRYASSCSTFNAPVSEPFNTHMGGITCTTFHNPYPAFTDTNNLSLAVFIKYANMKFLFPGDLEGPGWEALLQRYDFIQELTGTNVLVASHHGRRSGFYEALFDKISPSVVVISDKSKAHDTQETVPDYREVVKPDGVLVRTTDKRRRVLTTRRDGWIEFICNDTHYAIDTEFKG